MTTLPQMLLPILGLLVNIAAQILSFRYIPKLGLLKSVLLGFAAGFSGILILEFLIFLNAASLPVSNFLCIFITNLIIYVSLGSCYFNFISLSETACRVRILRELYEAEEGLSLQELLKRYNAKEIRERRIKRLLDNRQILLKNGRYYIGNSTMLLITRILAALKLILLRRKLVKGA